MTWLSLIEAANLLKLSERRLRDRLDELTTRAAGKSANGKAVREVLLESLPTQAQQNFFQSQIDPLILSLSKDSPVAVTPGDRGEGKQEVHLPSCAVSQPAALSRPTLNGLNESELSKLNDLADALRQFQITNSKLPNPENLESLRNMSLSTVKRKLRALDKYGLAGLARKPRADRGRPRVADDKIVARIKTEFLQPHRPAAAHIYKAVAKDFEMSGLRAPSYSFVLRRIKELDPDLVAHARVGAKQFDDKFALVTLRRKPAAPRLWCDTDHHILDHIVVFADGSIGRPWLTAIQDICTNEILGYVLSHEKKSTYPGANAIGLCIRNAVLKKSDSGWPSRGLFENFYSDLGKDFRSSYVRAVCHDLGIRTVFARGYHGKSKPIERWFGVLENGIKHLPGYVGRNPETNPLHQDIGPSRDWESMRGAIMPIERFADALHRWIVNVYHHTDSRALKGLSPLAELERHVKNGWAPREVASERVLDLLLMQRRAKKVQRFGIEMFGSKGAQRFFMAPELAAIVGQDVEVFYDPANIGELVIYKDDRFLCKAHNRELLDFGASEEDLARERDIKRAQKNSVRERIDELAKQAQYPNPMARVQAEKRYERVMDQEREKIAVNAQPAQRVYKLLPKFQIADRALRDGRTIGVGGSKNNPSVLSSAQRVSKDSPFTADEDLKSADELFASEKNPWLDEEEG